MARNIYSHLMKTLVNSASSGLVRHQENMKALNDANDYLTNLKSNGILTEEQCKALFALSGTISLEREISASATYFIEKEVPAILEALYGRR